MILIFLVVVSLVAWALHLMQQAIESKEFSMMLAGFLVSSAAVALMGVYYLMGDYVGYMHQMSHQMPREAVVYNADRDSIQWLSSEGDGEWAEIVLTPDTLR